MGHRNLSDETSLSHLNDYAAQGPYWAPATEQTKLARADAVDCHTKTNGWSIIYSANMTQHLAIHHFFKATRVHP